MDDDAQVRRALRTTLTSAGYIVVKAMTGEEALAKMEAEGPVDLVLLDLKMPGIGGLEACRSIRKLVDIPILVISILREREDKVQASDAGADNYLAKPFGHPGASIAHLRTLLVRTAGLGPIPPA